MELALGGRVRAPPAVVTPGIRVSVLLGAIAVVACGSMSCYATQTLRSAEIAGLREGGRSREIMLSNGQRERVRVRPASWIRFLRTDGAVTAWVEAKHVRVAPEFVVVDQGRGMGSVVLRWDRLAGVEINDLDMGQTVIGVVGGTSLVLVSLAAESMIVAGLRGIHIKVNEIGLTRAVFDSLVAHAGLRPGDDPDVLRPADGGEFDAGTGGLSDDVVASRSLFSSTARRRDIVRVSLAVESGVDARPDAYLPQTTAMATLRVANILEIGGGLSALSMPDVAVAGVDRPGVVAGEIPPDAAAWTVRIVPRVRAGLHLDLDSGRRVALVVAQEFGFSTGGWTDLRTMWGLRLRLGDRWQLGAYPVNPRVTWTVRGATPRTTYASGLELAWVF